MCNLLLSERIVLYRTIWLVLCLFCFCLPLTGRASTEDIEKIKIFYVNWNMETRAPLSAADVREFSDIKWVIKSSLYIDSFMQMLKQDTVSVRRESCAQDVRLVIDMYDHSGLVSTLVSDGKELCNCSTMYSYKIDDAFKAKFEFGTYRSLTDEIESSKGRNTDY